MSIAALSCRLAQMESRPLYNKYSSYLKERYGELAYRVSVDAGFSCPNRKNGRNSPGCIFCDEAGSRAVYLRNDNGSYPEFLKFKESGLADYPPFWSYQSVESQINRAINFLSRRYKAKYFLLYFQAFSSTYAAASILKEIYDTALDLCPQGNLFKELIVSTRADCIDKEKAQLLASYKNENKVEDVWCELGLQTASDRLLKLINRGESVDDFVKSYNILKEAGIKVGVHIICGLPSETPQEQDKTISLLQKLKPDGIKIHNLNVIRGTALHTMYEKNPFHVDNMEEHIMRIIYYLRRLPAATTVMRLTCDSDSLNLIAPSKKWNKSQLAILLEKKMRELGAYQGDLL